MKTVLKLVIAVALLNAVVRGADSAWNYYQLKDAAQRALLFGTQASSKQIHRQIMERAMELRVPLMPEDLSGPLAGRPPDRRGVVHAADRVFPQATGTQSYSRSTWIRSSVGTPPDDEIVSAGYSDSKPR